MNISNVATAPSQEGSFARRVFDLGQSPLRELNKALHGLAPGSNETAWEVLNPKGNKLVLQPAPPKATPPKPKIQPNPLPKRSVFHYEFCQRSGHLEEFYFRRKWVERQERAWGN